MEEFENEINLMEYFLVIWKRKWLITIPTLFCVILTGIISFILPQKWEVDTIIQPSKFLVQTEQGQFEEIIVVDPKQIASEINQETHNRTIASELKINMKDFPKLKGKALRDTNLVHISIREKNPEKAKLVLNSLFNHLKVALDKKVDVEIQGLETQISNKENLIKYKELQIKDEMSDIKIKKIEKNKIKQEITSAKNKLKISEDRVNNITGEMKLVKVRITGIEKQQRAALDQKQDETIAISLLLYSNEIQQNFRYYNTLDEKLSDEKIIQENLRLSIHEKTEELKQLDTEIEILKTGIEKINNEMRDINNEISLLIEKKARVDYTEMIKEPTQSLYPVSPRKKLNVLIAGILSLFIFILIAFLIEHLKETKSKA